jgi:hypothetical protein
LVPQITTQTGGQFHFFTGALMHEENVTRLEQQLVSDIQDVSLNFLPIDYSVVAYVAAVVIV